MEEIRAIFASVDILALITFRFQLGEITDIASLQHPEMRTLSNQKGALPEPPRYARMNL
jgi:hypothetical protein